MKWYILQKMTIKLAQKIEENDFCLQLSGPIWEQCHKTFTVIIYENP
jgi:hypothetical protein